MEPKELNDKLRQQFETRLATLASEIRAKLAGAREARIGAEGEASIDGGDRAVIGAAAELNLAEAARDGEELRELEAALQRMADGSYGLCIACGARITPARLLASPSASRCATCQTACEAKAGPPTAA